jgi:dUTP pyrophosphatase
MDLRASFHSEEDGKTVPVLVKRADGSSEELHDIFDEVTLKPGDRALIPTGIIIALSRAGYEAQVRPRSGLAWKEGITVINSPGTIDADYRNTIGVLLINHGTKPFVIKHGDRIAQMVINQVPQGRLIEVDDKSQLSGSDRGGGYGHTGVK